MKSNFNSKITCFFLFFSFPLWSLAHTQEQVQMANNPLAKANSIGFQNYYTPSLYGLEGMSANTFMVRPVLTG